MKLLDGREILEQIVDQDNRLIFVIKDKHDSNKKIKVYAEDVKVNKELPPPESNTIKITREK